MRNPSHLPAMMAAKWKNNKLKHFVHIFNSSVNSNFFLTRPAGPALTLVWVSQFNFSIFHIYLFHVWYFKYVVISSASYENISPIHEKGVYTLPWERPLCTLTHYITHEERCILLLMNFLFQNHPT